MFDKGCQGPHRRQVGNCRREVSWQQFERDGLLAQRLDYYQLHSISASNAQRKSGLSYSPTLEVAAACSGKLREPAGRVTFVAQCCFVAGGADMNVAASSTAVNHDISDGCTESRTNFGMWSFADIQSAPQPCLCSRRPVQRLSGTQYQCLGKQQERQQAGMGGCLARAGDAACSTQACLSCGPDAPPYGPHPGDGQQQSHGSRSMRPEQQQLLQPAQPQPQQQQGVAGLWRGLPADAECRDSAIDAKMQAEAAAGSKADSIAEARYPAALPLVSLLSSCRNPAGRCTGARSRRPPLLLVVVLLAALQGLLGPVPCAAAEWSWIWGKSKAASAVLSSSPGTAAASWNFYGLIPHGWRKHTGGTGSQGHSGSVISGSGRSSTSNARSSSSSSSRTRVSGKAVGSGGASHWVVNIAGAGGAAAGVVFSAGRVQIAVNPGGNVTALLEYDPNSPPPAPPPPEPEPKGKKSKNPKHRLDSERPRLLSNAQLALRELLLSKRLPFDPMKPYKLPAVSYKASDFVFATGSFPARYVLAQSTRSWRRGIRAFIAVNNTKDLHLLNERNKIHHEHYEYFPDDGTGDLGPVYHGYMAGDTRAAMAPFLAHQYFGETYKWLLYGDDDTLFYMPSVKRLLAHLDPELPIAISDNLWFRARHPNLFAPRCLPCHLGVDADPPPPTQEEAAAAAAAGEPAPEAKVLRIPNITAVMDGYQRFLLGVRSSVDFESAKVQKLMTKNTFGDFNKSLHAIAPLPPDASVPGVRYLPRPACPFCTAEAACTPTPPPIINVTGAGCFASGGHGGAGMIFSVGLLRRLHPDRMKKCYMKIIKAPGGDGMLSACLWEAGYAFTDPGASTLARYDGNYLLFSSEAGKWALHDPVAVLLRGKCDARCKWLLRNAATHHGRGRHFQNFEQSAAYLYANMASYTAAHKWLAFMAGRDDDMAELAELAELAEGRGEVAAGEGREEVGGDGGE